MSKALAKIPESVLAVQTAIESMNPALRREFDDLRELIEKTAGSSISMYYRLGEYGVKIEKDKTKYGEAGIPKLAAALEVDQGVFYRTIKFHSQYEKSEVQAMIAKRTSANKPLTWGHISQLVPVENPKKRAELLDRILAENLSTRALKDIIRQELATSFTQRAPTPRSAVSAHKGMMARTTVLYNQLNKEWRPSVLRPLATADAAQVETMLERLPEDILIMEKLAALVTEKIVEARKLTLDLEARQVKLKLAAEKSDKSEKLDEPKAQTALPAPRPRVSRSA